MFIRYSKLQDTISFKAFYAIIAFSFVVTMILPPQVAAQIMPATLNLPAPGAMVHATPPFMPAMLTGVNLYADDPLKFDFIIDEGDAGLNEGAFKTESERLIKYFLAALTVPEEELWVNLSPYEKDRIIPGSFAKTEMGRDLLAQDYLLKQLTASLMYPEDDLGQTFWNKVYKEAYDKFGTTDIPMNTFNKIWIVPEEASVYEHARGAVAVKSHLKVMLEADYLALAMNKGSDTHGLGKVEFKDLDVISGVQSQVVREVLIPALEEEVNTGKTFANLRQIYNAVILATWYKQALKDSLLGQVYVDQGKTEGINTDDPAINQKIYDQYVEAFSKGVYNFIKEDYDPATQTVIPRKYFSGGVVLKPQVKPASSPAVAGKKRSVTAALDPQGVTVSADELTQAADGVSSVEEVTSEYLNELSENMINSLGEDKARVYFETLLQLQGEKKVPQDWQMRDRDVIEELINGLMFLEEARDATSNDKAILGRTQAMEIFRKLTNLGLIDKSQITESLSDKVGQSLIKNGKAEMSDWEGVSRKLLYDMKGQVVKTIRDVLANGYLRGTSRAASSKDKMEEERREREVSAASPVEMASKEELQRLVKNMITNLGEDSSRAFYSGLSPLITLNQAGMVPEGWKIREINEIAALINGLNFLDTSQGNTLDKKAILGRIEAHKILNGLMNLDMIEESLIPEETKQKVWDYSLRNASKLLSARSENSKRSLEELKDSAEATIEILKGKGYFKVYGDHIAPASPGTTASPVKGKDTLIDDFVEIFERKHQEKGELKELYIGNALHSLTAFMNEEQTYIVLQLLAEFGSETIQNVHDFIFILGLPMSKPILSKIRITDRGKIGKLNDEEKNILRQYANYVDNMIRKYHPLKTPRELGLPSYDEFNSRINEMETFEEVYQYLLSLKGFGLSDNSAASSPIFGQREATYPQAMYSIEQGLERLLGAGDYQSHASGLLDVLDDLKNDLIVMLPQLPGFDAQRTGKILREASDYLSQKGARFNRPRNEEKAIEGLVEKIKIAVESFWHTLDRVEFPEGQAMNDSIAKGVFINVVRVAEILHFLEKDFSSSVNQDYFERTVEAYRNYALTASSPITKEMRAGKRILIVEDDSILRRQFVRLFSDLSGYEVTVARSGQEGLEKLENNSGFDLIVSDVQMPDEEDGFKFFVEIRSKYEGIPLLVTSSLDYNRTIREEFSWVVGFHNKGLERSKKLLERVDDFLFSDSAQDSEGSSSPVSKQKVGGIDLNPNKIDMDLQKENGSGLMVPVATPAQIELLRGVEGFLPVILNIAPPVSLPVLIGQEEEAQEDPQQVAYRFTQDVLDNRKRW